MLRSFRVANHRSIREEQELSLLPAYDKQRPVTPVTAIYGANASGKSNLLDALKFMRVAVRTSYASWEAGSGVPRQPFRLDPADRDRPSLYVVDLGLDGVRYSYGFAVDDERVREEWLYSYPHARRRTIFERTGDTIKLGSTLPDHRSREATLANLTRPNALLLSSAAQANQSEVMPAYDWFRSRVNTLQVPSSSFDPASFADRIRTEAADRSAVIELVRIADLGIVDIEVPQQHDEMRSRDLITRLADLGMQRHKLSRQKKLGADAVAEFRRMNSEQDRIIEQLNQLRSESPLMFAQGKRGVTLTLDEQSAGTRAWIALLDHVLTALGNGSLLVVDEIDTSLHPRLTARLVELFQDRRTNPNSAQLVFATHDASLLGTSFGHDILQRDQVWFVEKDAEGATTLFPLTDFHPRKEENTERRYLGGSYGAVPGVFSDSLVETYLTARPELLDDTA